MKRLTVRVAVGIVNWKSSSIDELNVLCQVGETVYFELGRKDASEVPALQKGGQRRAWEEMRPVTQGDALYEAAFRRTVCTKFNVLEKVFLARLDQWFFEVRLQIWLSASPIP